MNATPGEQSSTIGVKLSGGRVTTLNLQEAKKLGEKWPMLTCYDALLAKVFDDAGIPVLLVGDSASTVIFGHPTTLPVTVDEMLSITKAVVRGSMRAMVVADLPFGSYQGSVEQALSTAFRFMKEAEAHAVKLEGGTSVVPQIKALVAAGVPVMGHLGLTPQSVHQLGGYRVQGKGKAHLELLEEGLRLQEAGVFSLVLEAVPHKLGEEMTKELSIPVIGIGAGSQTDAQVLVWQDLLGLTPGKTPKFVTPYLNLKELITETVHTWGEDVNKGEFPKAHNQYDE